MTLKGNDISIAFLIDHEGSLSNIGVSLAPMGEGEVYSPSCAAAFFCAGQSSATMLNFFQFRSAGEKEKGMQVEMVLTVMASDRPGIVELLADVVASHEGNWVDSAMSRLGGEFAGILRIVLDDSRGAGLEKSLEALQEDGISISVRRSIEAGKGEVSGNKGRAAYFEVVGQDHKGIVRDVSKVLADNKVNVDELRTHVFEGSMSGEHMFSAEADIVLPDGLEMDELCLKLEELAGDLMVDVKMCSIKGK